MSKKHKRKHTKTNADENIGSKSQSKKEAVLKSGNKGNMPYIIAVCLIVGASAAAFFMSGKDYETAQTYAPSGNVRVASYTPQSNGNSISFDANLFSDGKARYFKYNYKNFTIKYFILKSSDGIIRAAFDACDVCWREGKGYVQQGDDMVCRNCGRRFASVLVNEVKGGCNPAPLKRRMEKNRVVINVKDIIDGSIYFNFRGRS